MRCQIDNLYKNFLGFNSVKHPVFLPEPRRAMAFPLPFQRRIVEAANGA